MCGRFLLSVDPAELQDSFPGFDFPQEMKSRFNIAPSQPILALPNDPSKKSDYFVWGMIPTWAKNASEFKGMINARAETLAEKPSFRGPFKYHRCLIPANGFYEWKKQNESNSKQPFLFRLKNNEVFAFAGLWDEVLTPDGSILRTCAIITTTPNTLIASIHNRMPVILPKEVYDDWLDPLPRQPDSLKLLLKPYASEAMTSTPVSTYMNNPANDGPACIKSNILF